jgi:hypothetical protein
MPWPTRAGVFGMARTMRSVPSQAAMLSLRMPAATLRCRPGRVWGAQAASAASRKVCGLTAHTTTCGRARAAPAGFGHLHAEFGAQRSRCGAWGSTTSICVAGSPAGSGRR